MQRVNADLATALTVAIKRIREEGERSVAPLDDDEKHFLRHLSTEATNPTVPAGGAD